MSGSRFSRVVVPTVIAMMVLSATGCGVAGAANKSADLKRQARLEQILLDVKALRERGATDREWDERAAAASQEFPKAAIDALSAEASRKHPYKQLHLWTIRDRMAKMFQNSRTKVSHEEQDYENNLREAARLLNFETTLPPVPEEVSADARREEVPARPKIGTHILTTNPYSLDSRPEGPLFYRGVRRLPPFFPWVEAATIEGATAEGQTLRLPLIEYLQGHWSGWSTMLINYETGNVPLSPNDPLLKFREGDWDEAIAVAIEPNSNLDPAFVIGKDDGSRDCRREIFDYQQQFGFDAAREECRRSLEGLYIHPVARIFSADGVVEPRTHSPPEKPEGIKEPPMDILQHGPG